MRPGRRSRGGRRRDDAGQTTVLILGFAVVALMVIGVAVDSTAAYVQRQGLDNLADGAALRGADLGAAGTDVYTGGVPSERLALTGAQARAAVRGYLRDAGAYRRFPGLTYAVSVSDTRVEVHLRAPLRLPLVVPGSPGSTVVGASGSAVARPDLVP